MTHATLARLPLSRYAIDREFAVRGRPALFDELWAEPATRVLPLWDGRALVTPPEAGEAARLDLRPVDAVTSATVRVYLGRTLEAAGAEPAGIPVIASVLTEAAARELAPEERHWANLRSIGPDLDDRDAGLFTEALAIANWHASHTHCPRCGTPTVVEQGGWVRRCFADDLELFPRTDAAVIVAVLDDEDRILLGSNTMWPDDRYSLLAGFVEPGESFEAAVLREVSEEAGVELVDPQYVGSQPWPFPASVMVGFRARLAAGQSPDTARPDGEEIRSVRWFTRSELVESPSVSLPGRPSIAHAIIEDWLGSAL